MVNIDRLQSSIVFSHVSRRVFGRRRKCFDTSASISFVQPVPSLVSSVYGKKISDRAEHTFPADACFRSARNAVGVKKRLFFARVFSVPFHFLSEDVRAINNGRLREPAGRKQTERKR